MWKTVLLSTLALAAVSLSALADGPRGLREGGRRQLKTQAFTGKLVRHVGSGTPRLVTDYSVGPPYGVILEAPAVFVLRLQTAEKTWNLKFTSKAAREEAWKLEGKMVTVAGTMMVDAWGDYVFNCTIVVKSLKAAPAFKGKLVQKLEPATIFPFDFKNHEFPRPRPPRVVWWLETPKEAYILNFGTDKATLAQAEELEGKTVKVNGTLTGGALHVTELAPAPAARRLGGKVLPVKQWKGRFRDKKDEPLMKAVPKSGYITDAAAWAALCKAWRFEEQPAVDFKKQIVLVCVADGWRNAWMTGGVSLSAKGDLQFGAGATELYAPGFIYLIWVVDRDGVKTIKGKAIADK